MFMDFDSLQNQFLASFNTLPTHLESKVHSILTIFSFPCLSLLLSLILSKEMRERERERKDGSKSKKDGDEKKMKVTIGLHRPGFHSRQLSFLSFSSLTLLLFLVKITEGKRGRIHC